MEENTIKLLYIDSKVHALISINQVIAGETGAGAVTQPVSASASFFISMQPLESSPGFVYMPYTRRVNLAAGGVVVMDDGLVEACFWPENIVELKLHPHAVCRYEARELSPAVISPYEFYLGAERYSAFIYNEAYSSFAVEHSPSGRIKFISPLPFAVNQAQINFIKIDEHPLLLASGKTAQGEAFVYAVELLGTFSTVVCEACLSHSVEKSALIVVKQGAFYEEKVRFEKRGQRLERVGMEVGWFSGTAKEPATPKEACDALVQAVAAGAQSAAMRCLTASLAEGLSFDDLREFFGDFKLSAQAISPACGQGGFALKYAAGEHCYNAREFAVETRQEKGAMRIDNIREP